jgi:hypothetical protein
VKLLLFYSPFTFAIINSRLEEIKKIDRKARKILTMYKMHHPKPDIDRLYVKRKEGGRCLAQIKARYQTEIINIAEYLNKKYKEDQSVNIIRSHDSNQPNMNSTVWAAVKIKDELSQPKEKNNMQQDGIKSQRQDWQSP